MGWLALLFTPLVVLSGAHELFLRNQAELDRTVAVLHPFWLGAVVAVLAAAGTRAAGAALPARAALWAYHVAGFAFLAWSFLRALPLADHLALWTLDTAAGSLAFAGAAVAAWVTLVRRVAPRSAEPFLAALALVLAAREAHALATRLDRAEPPVPRDLGAELRDRPAVDRPNVYHVILDAFQDELFEPSSPSPWNGFVRFHAAAPGRATVVVLPTIFTGRDPRAGKPAERVREGLAGETSLLVALRRAGYVTVGVVPRYLYADHPDALDTVVFHDENARPDDLRALHRSLFARLFAWRALPAAAVRALARRGALGLEADFVRSAEALRISTDAQPVASRLSLERLLEQEPGLPGRGRYTLVHALLPHNPYLLRADCSYTPGAPPTDLGRQTTCTLGLVERLLSVLDGLGRLDGSVVLVHGDHGSGEVPREGGLVAEEAAYFRTVLLVKPAGAQGPLRVSAGPARLADVAPTLLALLGLPPPAPADGRPLPGLSAGSAGRP